MIDYLSDKYPLELIKEVRFQQTEGAHSIRVSPLTSHNYYRLIPAAYRAQLCFEMGSSGHEGTARNNGIPRCGGCFRTYPWFAHFCIGCGSIFIRDFGDPRFCSLFPHCWDCLPELPWTHCPDHRSLFSGSNPLKAFPPLGLNPKTFSTEELQNVFDF